MTSTLGANASLDLQPQFTSNGLLDEEEEEIDQLDQDETEKAGNTKPQPPSTSIPTTSTSTTNNPSSSSSSPAKNALNNFGRSFSPSTSTSTSTSTSAPTSNIPPRVSNPFQDDAPDFDLDRELEMEEQDQSRDQKKDAKKGEEMELDDDELQALLEQEAQQDSLPSSTSKDKGKQKQLLPESTPPSAQLQSNGLLDDDDGYVAPSSARPVPNQSRLSKPNTSTYKYDRTNNISTRNAKYPSSRIPDWAREAAGELTTSTTSTSIRAGGSAGVGSSTSRQPYVYRDTRTDDGLPKFIPAGVINAVTFEGEKLVFERRKRVKGWKPPPPAYGNGDTGLLSKPIHELMDKIEADAAEAVVERDEAARRPKSISNKNLIENSTLWVDRYRPKKFAELLGDERVHREVLGWLKEWDLCVFKRRQNPNKRSRNADLNPGGIGGLENGPPVWKDPYGRPAERVLMLSGPPGLGKTTMAHVLATQAGYGVYELNASDSRTASAVEDQVRMALESSSMKDSKPTLVIVDEIDGATGGEGGGGGFIRALVKLIEGGKGWKGNNKGVRNRKGRKGGKPLLRPIICICNDLYAPALRPLRSLARMVRFTKPATNLLVHRLRDICEREALATDTRSLNLLAELTGNDIRSCLNALQFAKNRALKSQSQSATTSNRNDNKSSSQTINLSSEDIKAGTGIKDGNTTTHKVWDLLFRKPSLKEVARGNIPKDPAELSRLIVHQGFICGEYEKLSQGCFEHYPTLNTSDDGWWRYEQALDWLHFGNCLNQTVYSLGTSEMLGYVPWSFVPWNGLFANTGNPLPEYPRADYENYLKRQAFDEIVASLHAILPPNLRILFNRQSVSTELGPGLMRLLTPDIKPVSAQAVRTSDRSSLDSLVALMMHLNLYFVQDRNEAGSLIYRLEPALDAFTQFEGRGSKEIGPTRHAVRALVAREMEAARLRLNNKANEIDLGGNTAGKAMAVYRRKDGGKGANDLNGMASSVLSNGKKDAGQSLDFFGRVVEKKIEKKSQPSPDQDGDDPFADSQVAAKPASIDDEENGRAQKKVKVFYRHHEGSSNAVRKPVKLNSLL